MQTERGPLPLPQLLKLAEVSRGAIDRLLRDGILESWEEPIDPAEDPFDVGYAPPAHELNAHQERALLAIRARFALGEFGVQLLFGVTGSGKTEVYLRAVQDTLARGKTAIILVPEIALTLWMGRQCRAWFGARFEGVAVLHSALSPVERAREWWRVRNGEARVVVGTRSAIFAPLENIGLIIVDEEQENSYKQEETPRYHGRDVAIVRAKLENTLALLGSATPSLETFHHALNGKYELLTLASRVAERSMASVEIVDLREEFQRTKQTSPISAALHVGLEECLANKTQALILINRRGYSWSVLCRSCGASVQCENCSISMTYHKARNRLECHYCGALQSVPQVCPKCQSKYVYFFGEGSEQLEERLRKEFAGARIARLDRDTARTKKQFQETLGAFADGALDFLVGTQMLAKGHDFHARDAGGRGERRFRVDHAGLSRGGAHVSAADTGCGARGTRRFEGASFDSNILSRALRDRGCGEPGLPQFFRSRTAIPENDVVSTVHRAGERHCARRQPGESDFVVAAAFRIFCSARRQRVARTGSGSGAAGATQKGAPVPVFAEIAQALGNDEIVERRDGILRCERDSANGGAGGCGSAEFDVGEQGGMSRLCLTAWRKKRCVGFRRSLRAVSSRRGICWGLRA